MNCNLIEKLSFEHFHFPRYMTLFGAVDCGKLDNKHLKYLTLVSQVEILGRSNGHQHKYICESLAEDENQGGLVHQVQLVSKVVQILYYAFYKSKSLSQTSLRW